MSDTLTRVVQPSSENPVMTSSSRDRISVDLFGLKAALFERARAHGVSPSRLVREAVVAAIGGAELSASHGTAAGSFAAPSDRVRLSLRMSKEAMRETLAAARQAGLSPGAYVAGLVAGVPALAGGGTGPGRSECIAVLTASNAELSNLSRNIHRLTALLRTADVEPARPYRAMLDTVAGDVRRHLALVSRVLADLQPCGRSARSVGQAAS
ncbi:hypothetical protein [Ideonella azotifigens]|uniref:Ribbon-helix-helix protein CopG domain-containing protein n=3 Tax=Ideonella azotifigens TaxID=513160 RepID=A0ABN1JH76_9BURK